MSAVDTAWLRMDRPHNLMMICGVLLFRERVTLPRLRRVIDERFLVFGRFRKLPVERSGVYCHDLDTFRCLFEPGKEPRPRWFKAMTRRILSGLQDAAIVFHTTSEIRRQILERGIVEPSRLVQVPLGVSSTYSPRDPGTDCAHVTLKALGGRPFVLHVGSCISRKRIDGT